MADDYRHRFHTVLTDLIPPLSDTISVIGSGGKTSLLRALADELPGRVILTTTTKFMPFPGLPLVTGDDLRNLPGGAASLFKDSRIITAAEPSPVLGKLLPSALSPAQLRGLADFVIIEADGSRCLPLKAHAGHEPAVPDCTGSLFAVFGMSAFGRRIRDCVHRFERFCRDMDVSPEDTADAELAARHFSLELENAPLMRQAFKDPRDVYLVLNQADTAGSMDLALKEAERFRSALSPAAAARISGVIISSLRDHRFALLP